MFICYSKYNSSLLLLSAYGTTDSKPARPPLEGAAEKCVQREERARIGTLVALLSPTQW